MAGIAADSPVQYLKGVGPARAELFAKIGIKTTADLLEYFPFRYELEAQESAIEDIRPDQEVTIRGEVVRLRGDPNETRTAIIHDGTETCALRWFGQPFATRNLVMGATVIASGKVQEFSNRLEIVHPRMQVFPPNAVIPSQPQRGQRFVGVYRGSTELKSLVIRRAVLRLLDQTHLPAEEIVPAALVARHKLPTRQTALRAMHVHEKPDEAERARLRLAYEEFLLMELAIALRRRKLLSTQAGRKLSVSPEIDGRIRARFPFKLTSAQDAVIGEIARDLASGRPMTRLLQGDVGSGKTVVALYASLAAIAHGCQAAIMAPTEILAQQHYAKIQKYLAGSRVKAVLLGGRMPRAERAAALAAIENGELNLVVGTQALLEKDVAFKNLAMVVVDEQHKFGVLQRAGIRTKGPMPHYLVMTATPIPRTLSMTVFGDLDVSVIKQSPPGRGRVITKVVSRKKWDTVMGYVRQRIEAGEQAFVVCPAIGGDSDEGESSSAGESGAPNGESGDGVQHSALQQSSPRKSSVVERAIRRVQASARASSPTVVSAKRVFGELSSGPWNGLNLALLHGGLASGEKQRIMEEFAAGKIQALVATTVVEVGVDVANATMMIIESADRYGLSQLHQLRGRIGRGTKGGLCVLLANEFRDSGPPGPRSGRKQGGGTTKSGSRDQKSMSRERLDVLARTTDGFKIAEADLAFRGPGELFGTRQHGLPELRVGNLLADFGLLEKARHDAFEIVAADPTLSRPEHKRMVPALKRMFGDKLALIDAA